MARKQNDTKATLSGMKNAGDMYSISPHRGDFVETVLKWITVGPNSERARPPGRDFNTTA